jgi:hypothetical protein
MIVAIGPSILSSAGSSGEEAVACWGVGIGITLRREVSKHLNSRRREVTIPGEVCNMPVDFPHGEEARLRRLEP